jgi:hypothetical protein
VGQVAIGPVGVLCWFPKLTQPKLVVIVAY